MREKNRIYPFCDEVANKWETVSDWRFGQLMVNFFSYLHSKKIDPFYVEDAQMMEYFSEFMGE